MVLALPAQHAQAAVISDWNVGDPVGYCGIRRGQDVEFWQTILWSSQKLIGGHTMDGVFGPQTDSATRNWQGAHGLAKDGCAGYQSWSRAQFGSHYLPNRVGHMTFSHVAGPYEYWVWREPMFNLPVSVRYANLRWWMQNPATGEWNLRDDDAVP
jgi:Putative peptidoglycan binding domain